MTLSGPPGLVLVSLFFPWLLSRVLLRLLTLCLFKTGIWVTFLSLAPEAQLPNFSPRFMLSHWWFCDLVVCFLFFFCYFGRQDLLCLSIVKDFMNDFTSIWLSFSLALPGPGCLCFPPPTIFYLCKQTQKKKYRRKRKGKWSWESLEQKSSCWLAFSRSAVAIRRREKASTSRKTSIAKTFPPPPSRNFDGTRNFRFMLN